MRSLVPFWMLSHYAHGVAEIVPVVPTAAPNSLPRDIDFAPDMSNIGLPIYSRKQEELWRHIMSQAEQFWRSNLEQTKSATSMRKGNERISGDLGYGCRLQMVS